MIFFPVNTLFFAGFFQFHILSVMIFQRFKTHLPGSDSHILQCSLITPPIVARQEHTNPGAASCWRTCFSDKDMCDEFAKYRMFPTFPLLSAENEKANERVETLQSRRWAEGGSTLPLVKFWCILCIRLYVYKTNRFIWIT